MSVSIGFLLRGILLWAAYLGMILVNALSQALPIGNKTNSEIANANPVYVLPAGWTFSIWGLIYLLYAGLLVLFVLPGRGDNPRFAASAPWLAANFVTNAAWLVVFQYEFYWLSCVVIALDLYFIARSYRALRIGKTARAPAAEVVLTAAVSANLAWVAAATAINFTTTLYINGWTFLAPNGTFDTSGVDWAVMLVAALVGVAACVTTLRADVAYAAVTLWALWGIHGRQADLAGTDRLLGSIYVATAILPVSLFLGAFNRYFGHWWGPTARRRDLTVRVEDAASFAEAMRTLAAMPSVTTSDDNRIEAARSAIRTARLLTRHYGDADTEDEDSEGGAGATLLAEEYSGANAFKE